MFLNVVTLTVFVTILVSEQVLAQVPSRLPPDVVLDYSYDAVHLMNGAGAPLYSFDKRYESFLERLRQFPPDVLIVGKEAPFTHSLGPVLSFGGEENAFPRVPGHEHKEPRGVLSPEDLTLRIKAAEKFAADAHKAGVDHILPYITPMTMFANPAKRGGFLAFYDRWDQYHDQFDLGVRPDEDPLDWVQRAPNGTAHFQLPSTRSIYQPFRRYSMCINIPGWRQWQRLIVKWSLRVGYDGVWIDGALQHRCYGPYDRKLARKLGIDFGKDPERVWLKSYLRYFDDLRNMGARYLAANYIKLPFQRAVTDHVDLVMIERCWLGLPRLLWPCGVWSGYYPAMPDTTFLFNRTQGTKTARVFQNMWLTQLAYAMRGERGTHYLYRGPVKSKKGSLVHNESSALLALAEGAAFGGGVAVHVVLTDISPFLDDRNLPAHRSRKRFSEFARAHRFLFEGLKPGGDVAILAFPNQNIEALLEAQQVHESLQWQGVLVDVLDGASIQRSALDQYQLVIVPGHPEVPEWMASLSIMRSPDPITEKDVFPVKKAYQRGDMIRPLRRTQLNDLVLEQVDGLQAVHLPEGVFVQGAAWHNDQRLVLHVLDFQVPIGDGGDSDLKAVKGIKVEMRMPKNKVADEVRFYSPDKVQHVQVEFDQADGRITFTIPPLHVYGICEVAFR